MSRIRSEFNGTLLTSIDESHHLHCSTKIFAINFSKRIKLTEFDKTYGSECLQDKMSYENNLLMTVFRQSPANSGPFMKILEFAASFTANRKHPYTSRTLANGQSVREEYGRSEECKGGVREILLIV